MSTWRAHRNAGGSSRLRCGTAESIHTGVPSRGIVCLTAVLGLSAGFGAVGEDDARGTTSASTTARHRQPLTAAANTPASAMAPPSGPPTRPDLPRQQADSTATQRQGGRRTTTRNYPVGADSACRSSSGTGCDSSRGGALTRRGGGRTAGPVVPGGSLCGQLSRERDDRPSNSSRSREVGNAVGQALADNRFAS